MWNLTARVKVIAMSRHREPNSNHILSSALKWLLAERLLMRLAIDVAEHNVNETLRVEHPRLFDSRDPVTAEFLRAYSECLEFHMGGFVLRAEEFHGKVELAQSCFSKAKEHAGISVSHTTD